MMYGCAPIKSPQAGKSNLYNKILTIQKTRSSYASPQNLYLKLLIRTNNEDNEGVPPKETLLEICQKCANGNIDDKKNTFIYCQDTNDTKVIALEDDKNIYIYCQCARLKYGNTIFVNVLENIGDVKRAEYHYYARFEELPNLKRYPIYISKGYKYYFRIGDSDWTKRLKIMTIKLPKKNVCCQLKVRVNANSPNSFSMQVAEFYFSNQKDKNIYKIVEGAGELAVNKRSDDSYNYYDIYSNIFASGASPSLEILSADNLLSEYITVYTFGQYETIDTSAFTKTEPYTVIGGLVTKKRIALGNDVVFQYGEIFFDGTTQDIQVLFNTPFKEGCYNIQLTGQWKSDNNTSYVVSASSKEGFTVHLNQKSGITLYYLAIGK